MGAGRRWRYTCAELFNRAGNALCPCIGGMVGNCVGEAVGGRVAEEFGEEINDMEQQAVDCCGRRRVNKLNEMTMKALGYGPEETCICFPCLPASQILLVITIPFYVFNWFKLGGR